jgi:hypothetical protein
VATGDGNGEGMTAAHRSDSGAGAGPPADPFDPVALEARLAAARLRRNSALAARTAARGARPPAPAGAAVTPPRPIHALAARLGSRVSGRPVAALGGVVAGFCLMLLLGPALPFAARPPAPETATPRLVAAAPPVPVAPAATTTGPPPSAVAAVATPAGALPPLAEPAPRPEPRPAAHRVPQPAGAATRSARNAPRPLSPPEAVGLLVRDLNAATLGRTAAALGVRERVIVPGVPLSVTLDRRGLRLHERPVRKRRARR